MKIAVATVAFQEATWIGRFIDQFKLLNIPVYVTVSAKPWNGDPVEYDGTAQIAESHGATVVVGYWETEHDQRNYLLSRLWEYDYVLILDVDEFLLPEDLKLLVDSLESPKDCLDRVLNPRPRAFRVEDMKTYWKTTDYRLDPTSSHKPVVAVDPKTVQFFDKRAIRSFTDKTPWFELYPIPVTIYHMSWVKTDREVWEKINAWAHAGDVRPGWYENIWLGWSPEMEDVLPYGVEKCRAIYDPAPKLWTE